MAMSKRIVQPDGVPTEYHRVASLTVTTNVQNLIEVASYVDAEARARQLAMKASGEDGAACPYVATSYHVAPYDGAMGVEGAYAHLKTLPEFAGAADVPEGGAAEERE